MSEQASINVSIDKDRLVDAIANDVCSRCGGLAVPGFLGLQALRIWPSQDQANYRIAYRGGWLFMKYSGQQFPAKEIDRVHVGDLQTNQADGIVAVVWIGELGNWFAFFTETTKAQYDTYTGFDIYDDGSIYFVSQPEGISEQVAPSGSIVAGDILLFELYFLNDNGSLKVHVGVSKYDWDADSVSSVVDKWYDLRQSYPWKTGYLMEPKGQGEYIGVLMATRGNRRPMLDFIRYARALGAENPNVVKPW